jgi:membrane protein
MSPLLTTLRTRAGRKARRVGAFFVAVYVRYLDRHGALLAAGLALYALLAAAPMVVIVLRFVGPLVGERETRRAITGFAWRYLEPAAAQVAQDVVMSASVQAPRGIATVLALGLAAWASTRLFAGLRGLLDGLLGRVSADVGFRTGLVDELKTRGVAFLLVLASGLLIMLAVLVDGATGLLAATASARMHLPLSAMRAGNTLLSASLLVGVITLVLRRLPQTRMAWRSAIYGALFAGVATTLVRTPMLAFLSRTGASTAFGAAGSAIALLVWLYLVAQLLVLGAALAAELESRRRLATRQAPRKQSVSRSMSTGLLSTTSNADAATTSVAPVSATTRSGRPAQSERARSASTVPLIPGSERSVSRASGQRASSTSSASSAVSKASTSKPPIVSHSAVTSRRSS